MLQQMPRVVLLAFEADTDSWTPAYVDSTSCLVNDISIAEITLVRSNVWWLLVREHC